MSNLTAAEKVAAYIKLRDYKKAAEDEFKKSLQRVADAMEKLENELLEELNTTGADSVKCSDGTVYRIMHTSATVENTNAFRDFILKNNQWEAADLKANKTFVKEYMEQTGQAIPGLKITQMAKVGVRRS